MIREHLFVTNFIRKWVGVRKIICYAVSEQMNSFVITDVDEEESKKKKSFSI